MTLDGREAMDRQAALYRAAEQPPEEHARDPRDEPGFRSGPAFDERVDQLRMPPQSVQAEQAVLGGLMLAPDAWDRVGDMLSEEDFYRRDHQLIFRAIRELAEKKRPFDAVTLGEWFEAAGQGDIVERGAYLVDLASTTPSAANINAYAEIVRDKATLRRLIEVGTEIVNNGFQPEGREAAEILTDAQVRVTQLATAAEQDQGGLVLVRAGLSELFDELQGYYSGDIAPGIPVPWPALAEIIPGMADGDLIILAGRPGMGKTVGGMETALHVARTEGAAAVFSLEMSRKQLRLRMVSAMTGIPTQRMKTREGIEDHEWNRITDAMRELRDLPLAIDDQADLTIHQIRARARRMHAKLRGAGKPGVRVVVVDYLQLVSGTSKKADKREQEISEISRGLKLLAKELGCPVVALSQLNRGVEGRTSKRPLMSDLRESGAIEQDADAIVFFYREDYYNPDTPAQGALEAIVGKQRSGPTATAYLRHDLPCSRFLEWEGGRPVYTTEKKPAARGFGKGSRGPDRAAGED